MSREITFDADGRRRIRNLETGGFVPYFDPELGRMTMGFDVGRDRSERRKPVNEKTERSNLIKELKLNEREIRQLKDREYRGDTTYRKKFDSYESFIKDIVRVIRKDNKFNDEQLRKRQVRIKRAEEKEKKRKEENERRRILRQAQRQEKAVKELLGEGIKRVSKSTGRMMTNISKRAVRKAEEGMFDAEVRKQASQRERGTGFSFDQLVKMGVYADRDYGLGSGKTPKYKPSTLRRNRRKANPTKYSDLRRKRPSFYEKAVYRDMRSGAVKVVGKDEERKNYRGYTQQFRRPEGYTDLGGRTDEIQRGRQQGRYTGIYGKFDAEGNPIPQLKAQRFSLELSRYNRGRGEYGELISPDDALSLDRTEFSNQPPRGFRANRGVRNVRSYLGESRQARRRLLNDSRYISATEQAIIDRKIRQTEAEAKREKEIKEHKKSRLEQEEKIKLLQAQGKENQARLLELRTEQEREFVEGENLYLREFDSMGQVKFTPARIGDSETKNKVSVVLPDGTIKDVRKSTILKPEEIPTGAIITQPLTEELSPETEESGGGESFTTGIEEGETTSGSGSSIPSLGSGEGLLEGRDVGEEMEEIVNLERDISQLIRDREMIEQLIQQTQVEELAEDGSNIDNITDQEEQLATYMESLSDLNSQIRELKEKSNQLSIDISSPITYPYIQEEERQNQLSLYESLGSDFFDSVAQSPTFRSARETLAEIIRRPPPTGERVEAPQPAPEEREQPLTLEEEPEDFTFDRGDLKKKEVKEKIKNRPEGTIGIWSTKFPQEKGEKRMIFYTRDEWKSILEKSGVSKRKINANLKNFDKGGTKGGGEFAINDQKILSQMGIIPKGQGVVDARSVVGQLD